MPSQNGRLARPFDVGLKLARTYWQDMLDCLSQGDFGEAGDRNLPRLAVSRGRRRCAPSPEDFWFMIPRARSLRRILV